MFFVLLTLLTTASVRAALIVRDAALIETMEIQGVSLAMTPQDAFNHLWAEGYRASGIASFDDWQSGGVNLVRGDFSAPEGRSEITLQRLQTGARLVHISETFNRPREKFDTAAEIGAAQDHFGIADDDKECRVADSGSGSCRVADNAEDDHLVYGITALPTMIMRYASRSKELKDAMWDARTP